MTISRLIEAEFECPFCGEINEIVIDPTGGDKQEYIEDCAVCCNPVDIHLKILADGAAILQVSRG